MLAPWLVSFLQLHRKSISISCAFASKMKMIICTCHKYVTNISQNSATCYSNGGYLLSFSGCHLESIYTTIVQDYTSVRNTKDANLPSNPDQKHKTRQRSSLLFFLLWILGWNNDWWRADHWLPDRRQNCRILQSFLLSLLFCLCLFTLALLP